MNKSAPFRPSSSQHLKKWIITWEAYLFVMPMVVILALLLLWPLLNVLFSSFTDLNLLTKVKGKFVGFKNFLSVFSDPLFFTGLKNTIVWTFGSVAGEYIVGLAAALLLNQKIPGRSVFRSLVIIPWVVPIVVASILWRWMLNPDFGIINVILLRLGVIKQPVFWLGQTNTALYACIFVNIWRSFPFYTIAILAALQSIPAEELEAAHIDGASSFRLFISVIFPYLKGISFVMIVLHLIWTFNHFDFVWLLTEGGPLNSSEILPTLVYRTAFRYYQLGISSAIAVLMIIILIILLVIYFRLLWTKERGNTQ